MRRDSGSRTYLRKGLGFAVALSAITLGYAPAAHALLQLAVDVSGTTFTCADQDAACDTNTAVGFVGVGDSATPTTINGVDFFGSLQIESLVSGATFLNSSSLQVINQSGEARTVTAAVGGTDFAGPGSAFATAGGGTFFRNAGGSITMNYFIDANNEQGADSSSDTPGTQVDTFSFTAPDDSQAFSGNGAGAISLSAPFSMTVHYSFTLDGDGRLIGRSQSLSVIPEPSTLAMLGTGLLGLALFGIRRSK